MTTVGWREFIEALAFTRYIWDYLDPEQYREFQNDLASNPERGDLMPGTGGFRKIRFGGPMPDGAKVAEARNGSKAARNPIRGCRSRASGSQIS